MRNMITPRMDDYDADDMCDMEYSVSRNRHYVSQKRDIPPLPEEEILDTGITCKRRIYTDA